MNGYFKIILVTLLAVAVQHFGRIIYIYFGCGNTVIKHYPGACEDVEGFTTDGSEDMTLLPSGKVIFTSGLSGFENFDYEKSIAKGAMYVMDTNKAFNKVQRLTVKGLPGDEHFDVHGIHHWIHENNSISVFVVLHMPETVARFLYDGDKTLTLTKVYRNHVYMRNLNSIYVTSEDSFYVSNIMMSRTGDKLMANLEFILFMPLAYVLHVEGDTAKIGAAELMLPNGVTGDDKYVYVATMGFVRVYTKNPDHTLKLYKSIPVSLGSIDNIKLDAAGDLWVGGQNYLSQVMDHMKVSKELRCASTIVRIRDPTGKAQVEAVFTDDGSIIQASSGAIFSNKRLIIGSVRDKTISCEVNYLTT